MEGFVEASWDRNEQDPTTAIVAAEADFATSPLSLMLNFEIVARRDA
jgi:hypothetical protein